MRYNLRQSTRKQRENIQRECSPTPLCKLSRNRRSDRLPKHLMKRYRDYYVTIPRVRKALNKIPTTSYYLRGPYRDPTSLDGWIRKLIKAQIDQFRNKYIRPHHMYLMQSRGDYRGFWGSRREAYLILESVRYGTGNNITIKEMMMALARFNKYVAEENRINYRKGQRKQYYINLIRGIRVNIHRM
eukprot:329503_1